MTSIAELIAQRKQQATQTAQATRVAHPTNMPMQQGQQPLGGGNSLAAIKASLAKAKMSAGNRKNPALGTGWYLLKNGQYKVTEQKGRRISSFSFVCIKAIEDANGLGPAAPNYSGPKEGEEYELAIFQDGGFLDSTTSKNLQALAACMGWSPEYVKDLQSSDEGITLILELLKGLLCVSAEGVPTNQPCAFSNQVVVEIVGKVTIKEEKGSDGQPSYNKDGTPKMKSFTNFYWNKKIPLLEVAEEFQTQQNGDQKLYNYFGSEENFVAALEAEQMAASL